MKRPSSCVCQSPVIVTVACACRIHLRGPRHFPVAGGVGKHASVRRRAGRPLCGHTCRRQSFACMHLCFSFEYGARGENPLSEQRLTIFGTQGRGRHRALQSAATEVAASRIPQPRSSRGARYVHRRTVRAGLGGCSFLSALGHSPELMRQLWPRANGHEKEISQQCLSGINSRRIRSHRTQYQS